ncbi:hypothetical protein MMC06_000871 [Schaereria dolodes]|nr:hypothetical protein [Schaereria dolodes]
MTSTMDYRLDTEEGCSRWVDDRISGANVNYETELRNMVTNSTQPYQILKNIQEACTRASKFWHARLCDTETLLNMDAAAPILSDYLRPLHHRRINEVIAISMATKKIKEELEVAKELEEAMKAK